MKLEVLNPCRTEGKNYGTGSVFELKNEDKAKRLIKLGYCKETNKPVGAGKKPEAETAAAPAAIQKES